MGKDAKYTPRQLTSLLKKVALECETVDDEGDPVTNAEKLARTIWKKALGYRQEEMKSDGMREVTYPPESWAIQLIMERMDGKVATAEPETAEKLTAAERVGELEANYINQIAAEAAAAGRTPPPFKRPAADTE